MRREMWEFRKRAVSRLCRETTRIMTRETGEVCVSLAKPSREVLINLSVEKTRKDFYCLRIKGKKKQSIYCACSFAIFTLFKLFPFSFIYDFD